MAGHTPPTPPQTGATPPAPQSTSAQVERAAPDRLQSEARTWAMLTHITALAGFIGVPFGHLIGPLIIWAIKKDQFPLVDDQGKESLNFQLSMTIYGIVAVVLCFVLIGIPLLIAIVLSDLILVVVAAVNANEGRLYRYPITIRFFT